MQDRGGINVTYHEISEAAWVYIGWGARGVCHGVVVHNVFNLVLYWPASGPSWEKIMAHIALLEAGGERPTEV